MGEIINRRRYARLVGTPSTIIYTATSKLPETTEVSSIGSGLHIKSFYGENEKQLKVNSHTFENGIGIIELNNTVINISDYAFYNSTALTSITIPDTVTRIGEYAFDSCSLTSINIPSSVEEIDDYAFMDCDLSSIDIPSSVTSIGSGAFYNNDLTSVFIPASVTYIGTNPFASCSSLTSIEVSSNNPNYFSSNYNAIIETSTNELISGCKNTTILTNTVTRIGARAFEGNLFRSIYIPEGVRYIGERAFLYCIRLESITIPSTLINLSSGTFFHCSSLNSITSYATTAPGNLSSITFYMVASNGTLSVPPNSSGYDVWMRGSSHYLGYYNWTLTNL